jgi:very-short-patch-repair endonuclease
MYSSDIQYNDFRVPPPTYSERKLRSILRSRKVAFKDSQIIRYTGCDRYTPDLLVGNRLIVEVDGRVHDKDFQKTPDRIRQRALEKMGYYVLRVKNEEIQNKPDSVAERIIQKYLEVVEEDGIKGTRTKSIKIRRLEKPLHYDPIPREISSDHLRLWALSFNQELIANKESVWRVDYFKQSLTQIHPKLVTNQCAMERFILLLVGLNLHKREDGSLGFEYTLKFLKKCIEILRGLFSQDASAVEVHISNMYNISAPGFFKNLIFNGGPNINPGIVSIERKTSELGITVGRQDIKSECAAVLAKLSKKDGYHDSTNNNDLSKYEWLIDWMNKQYI